MTHLDAFTQALRTRLATNGVDKVESELISYDQLWEPHSMADYISDKEHLAFEDAQGGSKKFIAYRLPLATSRHNWNGWDMEVVECGEFDEAAFDGLMSGTG